MSSTTYHKAFLILAQVRKTVIKRTFEYGIES